MNVLAIDSSSALSSVALLNDQGEVIYETASDREKSYSEHLLPLGDELMIKTGFDISDVDAIAVAVGPGSFTGIRIGLATVKALGFAHQKKIIGVSTLQAMSLAAGSHPIARYVGLLALREENLPVEPIYGRKPTFHFGKDVI